MQFGIEPASWNIKLSQQNCYQHFRIDSFDFQFEISISN